MQAWEDASDGTILGSLGYGKVLESPAVAYEELQAQLLAYAEEHAPDSEAQQVTCCTAGVDILTFLNLAEFIFLIPPLTL